MYGTGHCTSTIPCNTVPFAGNFLALLDFRVDAGDMTLKKHLETAGRNATYTSNRIQNDLIGIIGSYIQNHLVQNILHRQLFSILADEATDVSNKEQLPLVLRYVDQSREIREVFVGFYECRGGVTGEAISTLILSAIQDLGLDMAFCRGQCYDGAGNMAGSCKGAATRIQQQYKQAIYVHCQSHRLNLCVVNACGIPEVRNMMDTLEAVNLFFSNSPKRQYLLEQKLKEECPETTHVRLTDICKTRWVQRLDALEVFLDLLPAILATLEEVGRNANRSWSGEASVKANGLYHQFSTFQFLVTLVITRRALSYTKGITVKLQERAMDVKSAYDNVTEVQTIEPLLAFNLSYGSNCNPFPCL